LPRELSVVRRFEQLQVSGQQQAGLKAKAESQS